MTILPRPPGSQRAERTEAEQRHYEAIGRIIKTYMSLCNRERKGGNAPAPAREWRAYYAAAILAGVNAPVKPDALDSERFSKADTLDLYKAAWRWNEEALFRLLSATAMSAAMSELVRSPDADDEEIEAAVWDEMDKLKLVSYLMRGIDPNDLGGSGSMTVNGDRLIATAVLKARELFDVERAEAASARGRYQGLRSGESRRRDSAYHHWVIWRRRQPHFQHGYWDELENVASELKAWNGQNPENAVAHKTLRTWRKKLRAPSS